jgi:hypothetical protein
MTQLNAREYVSDLGEKEVKSKHLTLGSWACYAKRTARPLRIECEDATYHLCAQGNARQFSETGAITLASLSC